MTINGWIQIALFAVLIIALTKPFGGYMTRVFNGERTFLSPVLRPVERALYAICGVDEKQTSSIGSPTPSPCCSSALAGFVDALRAAAAARRAAVQPGRPGRGRADLAFNTSVSFVTNTNWQSYVPETTMSYLVQMAGLTVHNFVSAATGIALAVALVRGFARRSAQYGRQFLGRSDPLHALHPAADLDRRRPVLRLAGHAAEPQRLYRASRRWKAPSR